MTTATTAAITSTVWSILNSRASAADAARGQVNPARELHPAADVVAGFAPALAEALKAVATKPPKLMWDRRAQEVRALKSDIPTAQLIKLLAGAPAKLEAALVARGA